MVDAHVLRKERYDWQSRGCRTWSVEVERTDWQAKRGVCESEPAYLLSSAAHDGGIDRAPNGMSRLRFIQRETFVMVAQDEAGDQAARVGPKRRRKCQRRTAETTSWRPRILGGFSAAFALSPGP